MKAISLQERNEFIDKKKYRFGSLIKAFLVFLRLGDAGRVSFVLRRGIERLRAVNAIETRVTVRSVLV